MNFRVQAFPTVKLFKDNVVQPPDYRSDRTVDAFMEYVKSKLSLETQLAGKGSHSYSFQAAYIKCTHFIC
jgi:hypothetical protein